MFAGIEVGAQGFTVFCLECFLFEVMENQFLQVIAQQRFFWGFVFKNCDDGCFRQTRLGGKKDLHKGKCRSSDLIIIKMLDDVICMLGFVRSFSYFFFYDAR